MNCGALGVGGRSSTESSRGHGDGGNGLGVHWGVSGRDWKARGRPRQAGGGKGASAAVHAFHRAASGRGEEDAKVGGGPGPTGPLPRRQVSFSSFFLSV